MCGTINDPNAQSCKYCGYIFEDYAVGSSGVALNSSASQPNPAQLPSFEAGSPQQSSATEEPMPTIMTGRKETTDPTGIAGNPSFVVTRSLVGSLVPALGYLVFISLFGAFSISDPISIVLIAVFALIVILPVLFSPRKYEFSDSNLRIHKIIGGDSEIPYSEMTLIDMPSGRRPQIALQSEGQRRPMVIPGNPENKEIVQNLKQFLETRVRKPPKSSPPENQENRSDNPSVADSSSQDASATGNL